MFDPVSQQMVEPEQRKLIQVSTGVLDRKK